MIPSSREPYAVGKEIKRFPLTSVASGGGGTPERPPPQIGKIVVEIWYYLPEVYTFGAESETQ